MDTKIKENFVNLWAKYFNGSELPITFFYTDREDSANPPDPSSAHWCVVGGLASVRAGESIRHDASSITCPGGKKYLGFSDEIMPGFEYFLSTGVPGGLEGERYKKSPELVKQMMEKVPTLKAPAQFIVFKRWDMLTESDNPEVAIFFARPDVLSGLFTLANFDQVENSVLAPFGSGCSSIIQYPYLEKDSTSPKAIIGLFDVSARPFVPEDTLAFAMPMNKLLTMIHNMEESFLITGSWDNVRNRIAAH